MDELKERREFLKSTLWAKRRDVQTDQKKGLPQPLPEKPYDEEIELINLVSPENFTVGDMPLREVISRRRSRRKFTDEPLTLEELSFLLWSTQGVREIFEGRVTFRTVPSAGARHPFETYLAIHKVEGLKSGLYRYLPLEHALIFLREIEDMAKKLIDASFHQRFVGECAVTFIWTAIPYRTEWRYAFTSHKVIAIDVGHVCQNLYLAAESIGGGTCAVAAYHQEKMDAFLGVDGEDEFTIYVAPVGKIPSSE
ncbi:SagB/ThcOx family dehydrogenase [Kosmotoga pacifica]|uniref:Nitroreductase n=1 Tax=Kosmotoga pacifica TaxID=1330330 RepID=A0A0G2Z7I9_9BACT|nr:SagB/ThcOx family dehydrogenase [Kosmotoga pacifica]AKI97512.1 nitroreductase [Kosmotoga pacifica]